MKTNCDSLAITLQLSSSKYRATKQELLTYKGKVLTFLLWRLPPQCLPVQLHGLRVGSLGRARRRVPFQHHRHPLPPLYRPRQPLLPAPRSLAFGSVGVQWP